MNLFDWLPAVSTSVLFALLLWLSKSLIATRLTKSVKNEFDVKLENIRANLRKSDEAFKAEIRSKEQQFASLREGALAALTNRQSVLDKRRIEAVDQLWSATSTFSRGKYISAIISVLKYKNAANKAAESKMHQDFFKSLGGSFEPEILATSDAEKARPFVSNMAWALFSAYRTSIVIAVFRYKMLTLGLNLPNVIDEKGVTDMIAAALPHQADYIAKFGLDGTHHLLDELENLLLQELQRVAKGTDSDKDSVGQSADILKHVEQVMASMVSAKKAEEQAGEAANQHPQ